MDVDELELPMLFCLLEEMEQIPPADFLAAAQMHVAKEKYDQEKKSSLSTFRLEKGKVRRRPRGD